MYQPRPAGYPFPLGDFVLTGPLGEGGSGAVYAAQWGHREVALKILHPSLVATERERERFFAEAQMLSEITHPGVVKVLNFGALPDGRPYLAMEKLDGETMASRLARGRLMLGESLALFGQMVDAVEALHKRGLVHRDLKPENVFLVDNGRYAVLLDFGIAKELDAPASTVTQDGGVRGTPAYMAPERFFGQPATPYTDIYELGVVLYAMLVGRLPWEQVADPEARLNPRAPSTLGVALPGRLEQILLKALSTRPESRPNSARGFLQEVDRAISASGPVRQTADANAPAPRTTVDLAGPGPAVAAAPPRTTAPATTPTTTTTTTTPTPTTTPTSTPQHQQPAPAGARPNTVPPQGAAIGVAPTLAVTPQQMHAMAAQHHRHTPSGPAPAYPQQPTPHHPSGQMQHYPGSGGFQAYTTTDQTPAHASGKPVWPWVVAGIALLCVVAIVFVVMSSGQSAQETPAGIGETETSRAPAHDDGSGELAPAPIPSPSASDDWGASALTASTKGLSGSRAAAKHHPAKTSFLLVVGVQQLLASEGFGDLVRALAKHEDIKPLFWAGAMCKVDPLKDVDWIAIGFVPGSEDEFDLTVSGTLDRAAIDSCAKSMADTPAHVWIDDRTLFFSTRPGIDAAWLEARKSGKDSVAAAAAGELSGIDPKASLWFHGKPGEAFGDDIAGDFPSSESTYGSIALGDEVAIELVARYADADIARRAVELANKEIADFPQGMVGTLEVKRDGPRLRMSTRINALITQMIAHMAKEALAAPSP